ncbi:MAG: type II toxin-antitoxin system VapC family toxin [Myxococcota bacterium]
MSYLLDTNTCIFALKGRPPEVAERLRACAPEDIAVSIITVAELWFGALKSARPQEHRLAVDAFLGDIRVLEFDVAAAQHYPSVRLHLQRMGTPISERDQLIACTALAHGMTVVTHNVGEYARVPGIHVQDWVSPSER